MFGFMRTSPIGGNINYRDYTFEGDGHLYAFQEAFHGLAEVDGMFADMNCQGVNAFAKGYHNGGLTVAQEAASNFMASVVKEGFFGDVKERLIKLLKTLKEKIKAFFHSAVQYFDAFFKDGAAFAEKYEDELRDKDLDGFKVRMYTYKALSKDYSKTVATWEDMKKAVFSEAKRSEIDITTEAFGFDGSDWVAALEAVWINKSTKQVMLVDPRQKAPAGWKKVSVNNDIPAMYGKYTRYYGSDESEDDDHETGNRIVDYGESENYGDSKDDSKSGENSKLSTKTTVKSITSAQRKEIRRVCMRALSSIDNADYGAWHKQLKKAMRDGVTTAKEITPDINDMIDTLKNSKEQLSDIKDIGDKFQDEFDSEIDKVKDMDKSGDNAVRVRNHVAVFTEAKNVFMEYFQVLKSVMIERNNAYKSCLSAALHYDSKNK